MHRMGLFTFYLLTVLALGTNAVSISGHSLEQRAVHLNGHAALARRQAQPVQPLRRRGSSRRCKAQHALEEDSSSTAPPSETATTKKAAATSTQQDDPLPPKTSTKASKPKPTPKADDGGEDPAPRPPASSGPGKQGLDWGADGNLLKNFVVKGAPVYNWTPHPPLEALDYGMNPVPMLWGKKNVDGSCEAAGRCWSKVKKGGPYNTVMGFNEPNQSGQSDMSYQEAVSLWKKHIEPLGMRTVSPATTSAPSGLRWMKNFVNACDGCRIDVIALHWYDTEAQDFIDYVQSFYDAFHKPIWVTEFACQNMNGGAQCSQDKADNFMRTVTDWMDKTWFVERYFAFGISHHMSGVSPVNQIMNSDGYPTYHGNLFLGRA